MARSLFVVLKKTARREVFGLTLAFLVFLLNIGGQPNMGEGQQKDKITVGLGKELEDMLRRWKTKEIAELNELEKELYAFQVKHSQDPDYKNLMVHIKNEFLIKNNVYTETSSVAALVVAFAAVLLSISDGLEDTVRLIISLLILVGIVLTVFPIVKGVFTRRMREKNFYEICINILE